MKCSVGKQLSQICVLERSLNICVENGLAGVGGESAQ